MTDFAADSDIINDSPTKFQQHTWTSLDTARGLSQVEMHLVRSMRQVNVALSGSEQNVMSFGATGDGVTDDSAAIQAAFDAFAAEGGGVVMFPPGTYLWGSAVTCTASNISIVAYGAVVTVSLNGIALSLGGASAGAVANTIHVAGFEAVADPVGTGGQQFIQVNHARDVLIEHCHISDFAGTAVKLNDNVERATIRKCFADNIGEIAFYSEGEGDGAGGGANRHIAFIDNDVQNFKYGIEAKETTDIQIVGNRVLTGRTSAAKPGILVARNKSSGDEITPARILISGNLVEASDQVGIDCTQCVDFSIIGNTVVGAATSGIVASGSNFVVSDNVVMDCDGGISAGYNASVHGGTGGVSSTNYDTAQGTVANNRVARAVGEQSFNFNDLDESSAFGNVAHDQVYAGYAFVMTDCDGLQLKNNVARGGSFTYGFRLTDTCSNMTVCNNESDGGSSGHSSQPSSYAGHWVERGYNREIKLGRVQTTDDTETTVVAHTIPGTHSLVKVVADVVMKSSSGSSYRGAWTLEAHAYRTTGGAVLQGSVAAQFSENNDVGLDATIDVDTNDLRVRVTGIAATNLLWEATLTVVKREI